MHNVREADLKMLSSLKRLQQEKSDRSINIAPAMVGIRGKVALEDFGLLSRDAFVDTSDRPSAEDEKLLRSELWELEQEGFGNLSKGAFSDRVGGQYGGQLNRKPLLTQNQVTLIKNPTMKMPKAVSRFRGQPRFLNSEPGTSATQSLPGIWSKGRNLQLDRRANHSISDVLADAGLNTRSQLRNRMFDINQTGSGQVPGNPSAASSEMVNQTQQKTRQNDFVAKMSNRLMKEEKINQQRGSIQRGGKGWPGVNPIQINIRPKNMVPVREQFDRAKGFMPPTIPITVPGGRLLSKMNKKVQKRKMAGKGILANQFKNIPLKKQKIPKPLFMDEHEAAAFAADALMPMITVN